MNPKPKVRIVDKKKLIFEIKLSQKKRRWIKIKIKDLKVSNPGCTSCIFYLHCTHRSPICTDIISVITEQGYFIVTPPHFNLCRV